MSTAAEVVVEVDVDELGPRTFDMVLAAVVVKVVIFLQKLKLQRVVS